MVISTRPGIKSCSDCEVPLYGTCSMLTPAICANRASARWLLVPIPAEAYVTFPGWAFAFSINRAIDLTPSDGGTTRTLGNSAATETGANEVSGS